MPKYERAISLPVLRLFTCKVNELKFTALVYILGSSHTFSFVLEIFITYLGNILTYSPVNATITLSRSPQSLSPGCCYVCVAWTSTKNEWNAQSAIWWRAFGPSITRNMITRVLTICHVKLYAKHRVEQKRVLLRSLSPALHNLWLLLV